MQGTTIQNQMSVMKLEYTKYWTRS